MGRKPDATIAPVQGAAWTLAGTVCFVVSGCARAPQATFDSAYSGSLIMAIASAAERKDQEAIPQLIECLDHEDPLVRFAAIQALERITGQTLDYDYAAPERERRERVEAWVRWYEGRTPAVEPADEPIADARENRR